MTPNEALREALEDMVNQFALPCKTADGKCALGSGGLSALEAAFDVLGWDDPHPAPWRACEARGCEEAATCGTLTGDGYKRLCGDHYEKRVHA